MAENNQDGKDGGRSRAALNEFEAKRFRSDRIFNANGEWYFHTREGTDVGPYASRSEAEEEALRLSRLHAHAAARKSDGA